LLSIGSIQIDQELVFLAKSWQCSLAPALVSAQVLER
jgi:hypothetical protein